MWGWADVPGHRPCAAGLSEKVVETPWKFLSRKPEGEMLTSLYQELQPGEGPARGPHRHHQRRQWC